MGKVLVLGLALCCTLSLSIGASVDSGDSKNTQASIFVDDVIVESTLSVRRKTGTRQGRTGLSIETSNTKPLAQNIDGSTYLKLQRPKRQGGRQRKRPNNNGFPQQFGANPQQQFGAFPQQQFGFQPIQPIRGSASSAQAQAQGFNSNGPLGGFGASAANAGSQGFSFDEHGFQGNAGFSGSQSYNLPGGNTLAISYANGFNVGPDGKPVITKGNSIAYTGGDGLPKQFGSF